MGVQQNWCYNYCWGKTSPAGEYFPAITSLPSSSSRMYHVSERETMHVLRLLSSSGLAGPCMPPKSFDVATFLAQCGDVESNPGPKKGAPDKAKIYQDKVDSHDTKLEELANLVK